MPPNSTDLDLFILALVQRGGATPYELKARAGISIGSSAPVLERLADAGLLKRSKPGVRDSIQFSITEPGKKRLRSEWQSLVATRPTDPDTILRVTYLAWALGREDALMKFIEAAADALQNAGATRRAEANQLQAAVRDIGAEAFRWLKTRFEASRLDAQAKELRDLGRQIKKIKRK